MLEWFVTYSGYLGREARVSVRRGYTATVNNRFDVVFLALHNISAATALTRGDYHD